MTNVSREEFESEKVHLWKFLETLSKDVKEVTNAVNAQTISTGVLVEQLSTSVGKFDDVEERIEDLSERIIILEHTKQTSEAIKSSYDKLYKNLLLLFGFVTSLSMVSLNYYIFFVSKSVK